MKHLVSKTLVLTLLAAGVLLPVAAEDLDAALAAQKKKAEHRIYSDSALIENHNLEVPRTPTEEERAIDKKLREMEALAEREAASAGLQTPPRAAVPTPQPVENKNWLTPAALDDTASASLTNAMEDAWLQQELDRQKDKKAQEAVVNANAKTEKLMREKTQVRPNPLEQTPLKKFQPVPLDISGSLKRDDSGPSYMTPNSGTPDPLAVIRPIQKKEQPVSPPLFSPNPAPLSSQLDKDPLKSTRSSFLTPNLGAPSSKPSSGFSSGLGPAVSPAPLTPIQMIKKSSPINRPDPFAEDHMPNIKSSIWE